MRLASAAIARSTQYKGIPVKLKRTTTDRPDFQTHEVPQPTCYDARDPIRPWIALDRTQDDYDDMQLVRSWARRAPISPLTTAEAYAGHEPEPRVCHPKHVVPDRVSTIEPAPPVDPATEIREHVARLLAELDDAHGFLQALDRQRAQVDRDPPPWKPLRYVVMETSVRRDAVQILLLPDNDVYVGVLAIPKEEIRLVAGIPQLISTRAAYLLGTSPQFTRVLMRLHPLPPAPPADAPQQPVEASTAL